MRRRTLRPSSRNLLVLLIMVLSLVFWACWELGRSVTLWRATVILTSGLTLAFFGLGWVTR